MSLSVSARIRRILGLMDYTMEYNREGSDRPTEEFASFSGRSMAEMEHGQTAQQRLLEAMPHQPNTGPQEPKGGEFDQVPAELYFKEMRIGQKAKERIAETPAADIKLEIDAVRELTDPNLQSTRDRLDLQLDQISQMRRVSHAEARGESVPTNHEMGDLRVGLELVANKHLQEVRNLLADNVTEEDVAKIDPDYLPVFKAMKALDENLEQGNIRSTGNNPEAKRLAAEEKVLRHKAEQAALTREERQKEQAKKMIDYSQRAYAVSLHTFSHNEHNLDRFKRDSEYYVAKAAYSRATQVLDEAVTEAWGDYDKKYLSTVKAPMFQVFEEAGAHLGRTRNEANDAYAATG